MSLIELINEVRRIIVLCNTSFNDSETRNLLETRLTTLVDGLLQHSFSQDKLLKLEHLIEKLSDLIYNAEDGDYRTTPTIKEILRIIEHAINICDSKDDVSYNTDSYYENTIALLNEKLKESQTRTVSLIELNKQLSKAVKDKKYIEEKLQILHSKLKAGEGENEELKKKNSELTEELNKLNMLIESYRQEKHRLTALQLEVDKMNELVKKYKIELEENRKRDDAINNWKNKISEAFKGLEGPLNRLVDEHKRLEWLYNVYKWSSAVLVFFLIIIEVVVYVKIVCSDTYPTWDQYLPMALPVPITLGLLWGFITQMNRAQRQMVVLSNKIHEIKYTEGLLQALNTLSVDIGESMSKINDAISRLIDNHLRNMDSMRLDEKDLSKIEKQNALPIEQIPELIKLINKSKE